MHSRPWPSMHRSCTLVPSAGKLIDEEGMVELSWETGCRPLGKVVDVITYIIANDGLRLIEQVCHS
jgi:hypothetical protein